MLYKVIEFNRDVLLPVLCPRGQRRLTNREARPTRDGLEFDVDFVQAAGQPAEPSVLHVPWSLIEHTIRAKPVEETKPVKESLEGIARTTATRLPVA